MSSDFWISAPTLGNNTALRIDPILVAFVEFVCGTVADVAHKRLFRLYSDTANNSVLRNDPALMVLVTIDHCFVYLNHESRADDKFLVFEEVVAD